MSIDVLERPEAVQVSTLVPLPLREELRARARKAGVGISDYLRSMIARELGHDDTVIKIAVMPRPRDMVALPPAAPKPAPPPRPETVLELIERGFTANQIAARLRMPYRQVLAELGRQVDEKVAAADGVCGKAICSHGREEAN